MRRSWVRRSFLGLVLCISVMPYLVVSLALNGQPSSQAFDGWLAILGPATSGADRVALGVAALEPGAPGAHPSLLYSIAVCGGTPFSGKLLIGGDARLSRPRMVPDLMVMKHLSTVAFEDMSSGQELTLKEVDVVDFSFSDVPKCASVPAGSDAGAEFFVGAATTLSGRAQAPVRHRWSFAGLSAPRTSSSWPLVGGLPGTPLGDGGVFRGVHGLSGDYAIPAGLRTRVSSGQLTPLATIEEARPQPVDVNALEWATFGRIAPTSRVSNSSSVATLQGWQVFCAILFGIGGSMMATVALDAVRRRIWKPTLVPENVTTGSRQAPITGGGPHGPRSPRAVIIFVLVVAAILRRRRIQPTKQSKPMR